MELGTFGAIMGFASDIAQQSVSFYEMAVNTVKDAGVAAVLRSLSEDGKRDCAAMEQTRRENVTEMILEPITGLAKEDYAIAVSKSEVDAEILKTALRLEERDWRFFKDSASKMPLPEVARVFKKMAQRKEKNLIRLGSLG